MRPINILLNIKNGIIIILLGHAVSALALESDEHQNLTIASESAEINRSEGTAIYEENVVIERGTTHVSGDKVTTHTNTENKLQEAIIESFNGRLSKYSTLTEVDKPELKAEANVIKFYPTKNRIVFVGNAKITQGTDSIQGPILEYDMLKQRLIAKNQSEQTPGNKHRTVIVIAPDGDSSFIQPSSKSGKPS